MADALYMHWGANGVPSEFKLEPSHRGQLPSKTYFAPYCPECGKRIHQIGRIPQYWASCVSGHVWYEKPAALGLIT